MTRSLLLSCAAFGLLAALSSFGCGGSPPGATGGGGTGGAGGGGQGGSTGGTTSTTSVPGTGSGAGDPGGAPLGMPVQGDYNLGPVEWTGSFNNACSPYPAPIETMEGQLLAGVSDTYGGDGSYCDACIEIVTAKGKKVLARVVTYGQSKAPGDLDVSQAAFDQLTEGEYPRTMTWQLVTCPGKDPLYFQFQTGANIWWTSLWVRNPRVAIKSVEVKSANHASLFALTRGTDGTFTDGGGFGDGDFTLHVTGIDGSTYDQTFKGFQPGDLVAGTGNL